MVRVEFVVTGAPVSLQTNNRTLLQAWKAKVRQAATACLSDRIAPTIEPVQVIITHYYTGNPPDIDNIVKPIIDALNLLVYIDDKQVTDLIVKRRNLRGIVITQTTQALIFQAVANGENFVHVKIDVAPKSIE